jgi:hypothetical protein
MRRICHSFVIIFRGYTHRPNNILFTSSSDEMIKKRLGTVVEFVTLGPICFV